MKLTEAAKRHRVNKLQREHERVVRQRRATAWEDGLVMRGPAFDHLHPPVPEVPFDWCEVWS